mmetsp:Transcript_59382/g.98431  ORF Transcript_59382/g.98431 Transcript_59382/m.98431 type:complete len:117 (-) Transcript_59382:130-480(-)
MRDKYSIVAPPRSGPGPHKPARYPSHTLKYAGKVRQALTLGRCFALRGQLQRSGCSGKSSEAGEGATIVCLKQRMIEGCSKLYLTARSSALKSCCICFDTRASDCLAYLAISRARG